MIGRRTALVAFATLATAGSASAADACTVTGVLRPRRFSERDSLRSLRDFVAFLNRARQLDDATLEPLLEEDGISFDASIADDLLDEPATYHADLAVVRASTRSADRPDRAPIRIASTDFLKAGKGVALYQFTLRRERYFAAIEDDGCVGDIPAHFELEDRSYLGVFRNNKLREIRTFPDWLRTS